MGREDFVFFKRNKKDNILIVILCLQEERIENIILKDV